MLNCFKIYLKRLLQNRNEMFAMRKYFTDFKRVVIKIGTTTLTYPNGSLNLKTLDRLAWVLTDLRNSGKDIILVSSGAITVGATRLGLSERPRDIKGKQAASAVGQAILMQIYEQFFMQYNQKVAQILLTKDVLENETKKENARNTFNTLLEMGVIPIVNENDTISTDELGFSENDSLSAYVALLIDSDLLILLSDVEGLYDDGDPKINVGAKLISVVKNIDDDIVRSAGGAGSAAGTGGMATKISAARLAVENGINTVIASGADPQILFGIIAGEDVGTHFVS